ncbi:flippase activity-associated protein Agl23 [Haloarculaceae archaeon H-GB2-1]|nr:flippase activity-associated protein Agl23 [Haloarculaceae archaeon H-GB11]MEA5407557.1 flippase activity-associated protein Agl23 [Haloarculaceae archaeon H-GB2-1]
MDDRVRDGRPAVRSAVVGLTILALVLRLYELGLRNAHWDEGRVAYWILRRSVTGVWEYRPIIHGPFVQHTTRLVFELLGPTDATMRLVVALVGGLLPLAALLYRTRLSDAETLALALVLSVNPLLLYFSRFLRSDVPLAAFAFVAFGFLLRGHDTNSGWHLLGAGFFLALGATAKENVVLYLLSWAGAATMVLAWDVWRRRDETPGEWLRHELSALADAVREHALWVLGAALVGFLVLVVFYAPRGEAGGTVGLWAALSGSGSLLSVVEAATLGSWHSFVDLWLAGDLHGHAYLPFLAHYLVVLLVGAGPLLAFAVVGFLDGRQRWLVAFCGWWGLSAVVGYPYATDIKAPWLAVHAVVAFAVPAAVGLVSVTRRARSAVARGTDASPPSSSRSCSSAGSGSDGRGGHELHVSDAGGERRRPERPTGVGPPPRRRTDGTCGGGERRGTGRPLLR